MRIKKTLAILLNLLLVSNLSQAAIPERKGWWKFDHPQNLTEAESGYGENLILAGTQNAVSGQENGNGAVLIGPGSFYKMKHLISPDSPSQYVNEYSLQFDFKLPEIGIWHSFFQTSVTNNNDGDFFINPSGNIGVGAVGYSTYAVSPNQWYRLIVSVKNGNSFTCYLDGNLILTGTIQPVNGRFSLDSLLLIFADDDSEDGNLICSELSIWDQALNAEQAKELGGFGHQTGPTLMTRIPYLQSPGINTMTICWHDSATSGTKVIYGLDSTLTNEMTGTSEIIKDSYRWHSVKLSGLVPATRYFYKVASGNGESGMYSFKTSPDIDYSGKLRFILLSDTHSSDTTSFGKIIRAAKNKIEVLYGSDIENQVNGIFHSGDIVVSGSAADQYTTEFFGPLSVLSGNIPTMVVAGNHEGESPYFYKYLKLDDHSPFSKNPALNEKVWQEQVANSLFIGLNTNIIEQYGSVESAWLNNRLNEAEQDVSIDFVFLFMHHPPYSELWGEVSAFDGGANYVKNVLFPIIGKYTKVRQLHSGHTHGFERGTILSEKADGDFRYVIGGGGGGPLDRWGSYINNDYPDTHMAIDDYCFQILEIDVANHSYEDSMFSLGNPDKPRNSEVRDHWYKKLNQPGPATPSVEKATFGSESIQFNTSTFSGMDSLMTVAFQVSESSDFVSIQMDSLVNWTDIFGVDNQFNPIDRNQGINLYQTTILKSGLTDGKTYFFRVRYRDHNLKWSDWSSSVSFSKVGITNSIGLKNDQSEDTFLGQNYPNPFQQQTTIEYRIEEMTNVLFRIYDQNGRLIQEMNEGTKPKGNYHLTYRTNMLNAGIYFYQMITNQSVETKKMTRME